jgi:hypothetical protein
MFQCSAFRSVIIPANCSGRSPDVVPWTGRSSLPKGRPLRPAHVVSSTWTIFRLVKAADHESPSRIRAQPTSPLSPNNSKCGCLLFAAEKAGIAPENELEAAVPAVVFFPSAELGASLRGGAGRGSEAARPIGDASTTGLPKHQAQGQRKDNAYNQGSAAASKKSAKQSRDATPGSSSAPSGASEMGRKTGGNTKAGGLKGGDRKRPKS